MSICVCGFGIAEHAMGDTVCKNFVEAKAMSEKNEEIACNLCYYGHVDRPPKCCPNCRPFKEHLDYKDRDHEALIGVLVGALERVVFTAYAPPDCKDCIRHRKIAYEAIEHYSNRMKEKP